MTGESFAADPALRKRFAGIAPLNRVGDAADIAAMAVFLSSDEASFVTGADFRVDGGTLAGHPGL
jgi:NAD(P)-dependent dehydrogenase (short-subunit alcohol dehydrogenase family)